ncbi:Mss4-like protein [Podospora aff. communis PSN243]|uniref:Mss4-like protein n=1 Tax=Podospora aff. communis PSN243 TaxID=3040156 RepID=A0AAV9H2Z0_9PEZI|nr:Mss4-like protein [Podospora aff. communis PSN243]
MSTAEDLKTYRANCHCGGYIFEVKTHEIKTAIGCNCSSCSKKAYLWLFLPEGSVSVIKDDGLLSEFVCGPHKSTHRFCSRCGTSVFATNPAYRPGTAVNARTLQDLDIWSLTTPIHDGAKINPQWIPPVYSGPEPVLSSPTESSPGVEYRGSCRCGAVQIAVKLASPVDSTYPDPIVECNCSICQRGGYIWIYPKKEQIALQGAENLTGYAFGNKVWKKMFCRVCGVHIMSELNVSEEEFETLPEEVRLYNAGKLPYRGVNVRVFNGLDVGELKTRREDGWGCLKPDYVNP